ncbi:hypothetical protein J4Q44_G00141240 [Coregonus suidteri]|uniref:Uncharacterized protein n=1 Tax=Coregonus suidteri TaxID=861788 RepID=A0AAN8LM74_9TELE
MCLDIMDTKVEFEVLKPCYTRRSAKLSKCRLRKLLHLSSKEGLKRWRTNIVKATLKKYIRCEQKRLLAKLVNQEQLLTEDMRLNRSVADLTYALTLNLANQATHRTLPVSRGRSLAALLPVELSPPTSALASAKVSQVNLLHLQLGCCQIDGHMRMTEEGNGPIRSEHRVS